MSKGVEIVVLGREPERGRYEGNGVVREYWRQWATLTVDGLPTSFEFSSDEPLPQGPANLDPRSFSITNGRLSIGRVRLVPVQAARAVQPAPAAAAVKA